MMEILKNPVRRLVGRPQAPPASKSEDGRILLNLGCGDKLLPNYINVDIVAARRGFKPDYQSDLRDLTLPSNYADEILAVHVIEHFYYWEAEEILQKWKRVLKPKGKIILELPNLLSAAKELVSKPGPRSKPGREGQRAMWVFYGDPAWKDPLMCHKWGYTPTSMKALLQSVGFKQVQQEPAQFKLREPRDMRMVGFK